MPQLLSPSLHQIPDEVHDEESLSRKPHLNHLVNRRARETLVLRHEIKRCMQDFLHDDGFVHVSTPILTAGAGGAVARPFMTTANEFEDTALTLRIAPELYLKRLVVGGLNKVYEIGPVFRNEGIL